MNEIPPKHTILTSCQLVTGPGSVVSNCSSNDDINGNTPNYDNSTTAESDMFLSCLEHDSEHFISCAGDNFIGSGKAEIQFFTTEANEESQLEKLMEQTYQKQDTLNSSHEGKTGTEEDIAKLIQHGKVFKEETANAREIRLAQNRKAARDSRKRKKNMVTDLQRTVTYYARANLAMRQQNEILQNYLNNAILQIRSIYPTDYQQLSTFFAPIQNHQLSLLNSPTLVQTGLVVPDSYTHNHVLIKKEGEGGIPKHLRDHNCQTYFVAKNLLPITPKIQGYQLTATPASVINVSQNQAYQNPVSHKAKYTVPNPLAGLDQVFAQENNTTHTSDNPEFDDSTLKESSDQMKVAEREDVSSPSSHTKILSSDSVGFLSTMAPSIFQDILNEFRK